MKKWIVTSAGIGVLAVAAVVWAEPGFAGAERRGGPGAMRGPDQGFGFGAERARKAGVNDEQRSQLRELAFEHEKNSIVRRSELALARLEMRRLMESDEPDEDALMELADQVTEIEGEQRKDQLRRQLQMRKILGPEALGRMREQGRQPMRDRMMQRPQQHNRGAERGRGPGRPERGGRQGPGSGGEPRQTPRP